MEVIVDPDPSINLTLIDELGGLGESEVEERK